MLNKLFIEYYVNKAVFLTIIYLAFVEGQNENITLISEPTIITSPGYDTGSYGSFENYHYRITTNIADNIIQMTPLECDIEHSEDHGCTDKLLIYDGFDQSANQIQEFCCQIQPFPTINSTGGVVYMVFKSDKSVQKLGFRMSVISTSGQSPVTYTSAPIVSRQRDDCPENPDYSGVIMGCTIGTVTILAILLAVLLCYLERKNLVSPMDRALIGGFATQTKSQMEQLEITDHENDDGRENRFENFDDRQRGKYLDDGRHKVHVESRHRKKHHESGHRGHHYEREHREHREHCEHHREGYEKPMKALNGHSNKQTPVELEY